MKMMMTLILFFCCGAWADQKATHREHGSHVHGAGTVAIAFDGSAGTIEIRAPGDSIFGFEHAAHSEKEKSIEREALEKLESRINDLVSFEPTSRCLITKDRIEVTLHGSHGEAIGRYNVKCEKSVVGTRVTFHVQKYFPRLKDVDVTILAGDVQASGEIKKDGESILVK